MQGFRQETEATLANAPLGSAREEAGRKTGSWGTSPGKGVFSFLAGDGLGVKEPGSHAEPHLLGPERDLASRDWLRPQPQRNRRGLLFPPLLPPLCPFRHF